MLVSSWFDEPMSNERNNDTTFSFPFSHHHPTSLLLQTDYATTASKSGTGVGEDRLANGKKQVKVDLEGESGVKMSSHYNKIIEANNRLQRSAKRMVRGCEKFFPALAELFCLALPGC